MNSRADVDVFGLKNNGKFINMTINKRKKIIKILDRNFEISQPKIKNIFFKPFYFLFLYFLLFFNKFFFNLNFTFQIKSKTIFGSEIIIILPSYFNIFTLGFTEYKLTKFLLKNLKEKDVFIDAGAHIGYYTLLASKLVGKKGKVIAFEPTPSIFKILKKNIKNKINIIAKNVALFNKNKIDKIKFVDYGLRNSTLNTYKRRTINMLKNKGKEIRVNAITLDVFCRENNIKPTFIKLDTEGSESLVLEGMVDVLKNIKPILSIEVGGGDEWAMNNQKSIAILIKSNYTAYEINKNGDLFKHKTRQKYIYENLIFMPNS